jgi:hypothetical protein
VQLIIAPAAKVSEPAAGTSYNQVKRADSHSLNSTTWCRPNGAIKIGLFSEGESALLKVDHTDVSLVPRLQWVKVFREKVKQKVWSFTGAEGEEMAARALTSGAPTVRYNMSRIYYLRGEDMKRRAFGINVAHSTPSHLLSHPGRESFADFSWSLAFFLYLPCSLCLLLAPVCPHTLSRDTLCHA